MKSSLLHTLALLLPLATGTLGAQEEIPLPANLAAVENARSQACVGSLARLAEMDAALEPHVRRVERLNALGRAVSLEKASDAAPFEASDPLEAAVADWFAADSVLAIRLLAGLDSVLVQERRAARTAMLDRLRTAIQELSAQAQARLQEDPTLQEAVQPCEGAILVRSAVAEACATTPSPVCEAAQAPETRGTYRFVDSPEDLWDVEEYGPWNRAEPLGAAPDGGLAGAFTSARGRRGNVVFILTLRPILEERSTLTQEQIAAYQANLDSLGFTFQHPGFIMAPALEIQAALPAPLGGESVYVAHFGDLSGDDDVIWTQEAGSGGTYRSAFPATETVLVRLAAGELVSLTALRMLGPEGAEPGDQPQAEAVYTVPLLQVGQANFVSALLAYMSDGSLGRDLLALIPPGSGG